MVSEGKKKNELGSELCHEDTGCNLPLGLDLFVSIQSRSLLAKLFQSKRWIL